MNRLTLALLMMVILVSACSERGLTPDQVPTIASRDAVATAVLLTENAPPPGFRGEINFPAIDNETVVIPSWTAEVTIGFNGQFAGTGRLVSGTTSMKIWYRQVGQRRRVVVERSGDLLRAEDGQRVVIEGVRIADNAFVVQDNVCAGEVQPEAGAIVLADLRARDLIGGVASAEPFGMKERINGEDVWRYAFTLEDMVLPPVMQGGTVTAMTGELWLAPEHNAIIRYYANLEVENAIVFNSDAPVSGQLIIRYDLLNIGVDPNISRPFGC